MSRPDPDLMSQSCSTVATLMEKIGLYQTRVGFAFERDATRKTSTRMVRDLAVDIRRIADKLDEMANESDKRDTDNVDFGIVKSY